MFSALVCCFTTYPACLQHGLCFGLCLSVPLCLVGFWLVAGGFCRRRVFYKATGFAQVTRKQRCLVRQQKATRDAMVFLVATLVWNSDMMCMFNLSCNPRSFCQFGGSYFETVMWLLCVCMAQWMSADFMFFACSFCSFVNMCDPACVSSKNCVSHFTKNFNYFSPRFAARICLQDVRACRSRRSKPSLGQRSCEYRVVAVHLAVTEILGD